MENELAIGLSILGALTAVVVVLTIIATVDDARKYKRKTRRYITSHFSTEWKDGEEVCSAILWNYNDEISKAALMYEVEKMFEEGLLQFRPRQGTSLMGEYRLAQTASSS